MSYTFAPAPTSAPSTQGSAVDQAVAYAQWIMQRARNNPDSITWDDMQAYRQLEGAARTQAANEGSFSGTGVLPFIQFNDLLGSVQRGRTTPLRSPVTQDRIDYKQDPNNWNPAPNTNPGGLLPNPDGPYTGIGPTPPDDYQPSPPVQIPTNPLGPIPDVPGGLLGPPTQGGLPLPPGGGSPGAQPNQPYASWGFQRGPNGELLPVMLSPGANPFQRGMGGFGGQMPPAQNQLAFPQFQFDPALGRFAPVPPAQLPPNPSPPGTQPPPDLLPPGTGNTGPGGTGPGGGNPGDAFGDWFGDGPEWWNNYGTAPKTGLLSLPPAIQGLLK